MNPGGLYPQMTGIPGYNGNLSQQQQQQMMQMNQQQTGYGGMMPQQTGMQQQPGVQLQQQTGTNYQMPMQTGNPSMQMQRPSTQMQMPMQTGISSGMSSNMSGLMPQQTGFSQPSFSQGLNSQGLNSSLNTGMSSSSIPPVPAIPSSYASSMPSSLSQQRTGFVSQPTSSALSQRPGFSSTSTPSFLMSQPTGIQGQQNGLSTQQTGYSSGLRSQPTGLMPQKTGFQQTVSLLPQPTGYTGMPTANFSGPLPRIDALQSRMMPSMQGQDSYSVQGLQGNASIPWALTAEEKRNYQQIFKAWDTNKSGYISGSIAQDVFKQSGLSQNELAQVWNLSDPQNRGKLDLDEFRVAMGLIYRKLNGYKIPPSLPPEMIPPSARDLSNSVDALKDLLKQDQTIRRNTGLGLNSTASNQKGVSYAKARSFNESPVGSSDRKDGTMYRFNESEIAYNPSSRRRAISPGPSEDNYREDRDRGDNLAKLKKSMREKQIVLDALEAQKEDKAMFGKSADRAYLEERELEDVRRRIRRVQDEIDHMPNTGGDGPLALMTERRSLEDEVYSLMRTQLPSLVTEVRHIESRIADLKLQLFRLRDAKAHPNETGGIIGTGPGGTVTEADRRKAKASHMLQARMAALTGKPAPPAPSEDGSPEAIRRLEEETRRVDAEKAEKDRIIRDIETSARDLQSSIDRTLRETEDLGRGGDFVSTITDSDRRRWEDGLGVEEKTREFIDDLRRESARNTSKLDTKRDTTASPARSTYPSSASYQRDSQPPPPAPAPAIPPPRAAPKPKTAEERKAYIAAEADRRMKERLKALGISSPADEKASSAVDTSVMDRLARDKQDAQRRLEQAEKEAAERERIRQERIEKERAAKGQTEVKLSETKAQQKIDRPPPPPPPSQASTSAPPPPAPPVPVNGTNDEDEALKRREEALLKEREARAERLRKLEADAEQQRLQDEKMIRDRETQLEAAKLAREEASKLASPSTNASANGSAVPKDIQAPPPPTTTSAVPPPPPPPPPPASSTAAAAPDANKGNTNPFLRMTTPVSTPSAALSPEGDSTNPFLRLASQSGSNTAAISQPSAPVPHAPRPPTSLELPKRSRKDEPDEWGASSEDSSEDDEADVPAGRAPAALAAALFGGMGGMRKNTPQPESPKTTSPQVTGSAVPPPPPPPPAAPPAPVIAAAPAAAAGPPPPPSGPPPPTGPPPPPSARPAAPPAPAMPPAPTGDRSGLLSQIQMGAKLRKTATNDRSKASGAGMALGTNDGPLVTDVPLPTNGLRPDTEEAVAIKDKAPPVPGFGSLFAGGIPSLKSAAVTSEPNGIDIPPLPSSASAVIPPEAPPQPNNRASVDWYGSLASEKLTDAGLKDPPKSATIAEESEDEFVDATQTPVIGTEPTLVPATVVTTTATSAAPAQDEYDQSLQYRVRTLYGYTGQRPEDLEFKDNLVLVAHPNKDSSSEWWYGTTVKDGRAGWFPKTYVERIDMDPASQATALYAYAPANADEIALTPGAALNIVDKSDPHWWKAEDNGVIGLVPASYLTHAGAQDELDTGAESETSGSSKSDVASNTSSRAESSEDEGNGDDREQREAERLRVLEAAGIMIRKQNVRRKKSARERAPTVRPRRKKRPAVPLSTSTSEAESPRFSDFALSGPSSPRYVESLSGPGSPLPAVVVDPARDAYFGFSPSQQHEINRSASPSVLDRLGIGSASRKRTISVGSDGRMSPTRIMRADSPSIANTWASLMDPGALESISPEEKKRQEAIYELISTEQSYTRNMQLLVEAFYGPLQSLLSERDLRTIFSNVEDILLCNTALLSDLEDRQRDNGLYVDCVGDIMLRHTDGLRAYIEYCANQSHAAKYLQRKREQDKRLGEFLKRTQEANPAVKSMDLSSFLLQPMQRLARFPLLLRQILIHTDAEHKDRADLVAALAKAEALCEETNDAARVQENQAKLREISRRVWMESLDAKLDLTAPTRLLGQRQFVYEGPLQKAKSGRKLYCFLFNDLLILTTPAKNDEKVLYRLPIPLNEASVRSTTKDDIFAIVHLEETINFKAPSAKACRKWMHELEKASNENALEEKKRGSSTSGQPSVAEVIGSLRVLMYEGSNFNITDNNGVQTRKMNTYCQLTLHKQTFNTKVARDTSFPKWDQPFLFRVTTLQDVLKIRVYSYDKYTSDTYLGRAEIPLEMLEKYYQDRETDKITLQLRDVPEGASIGSLSMYMAYKPL